MLCYYLSAKLKGNNPFNTYLNLLMNHRLPKKMNKIYEVSNKINNLYLNSLLY